MKWPRPPPASGARSIPCPRTWCSDLAGKEPEDILARGVEAAARLVKQIKQEKLADGVYLKAKGRTDLFTKILKAAGL